jgi:8-oxo-dGTP pyrophosphatase MutT (NUDIX family)
LVRKVSDTIPALFDHLSLADMIVRQSAFSETLANRAMTMPASSAGILMYRRTGRALEVLLVHPGGPFWRNKDDGAWSIPKGEIDEGEDLADAALREFMEEIGSAPDGPLRSLGEIRQRGGKRSRLRDRG